jgi:hypothetical protein
MAKLAVLQDKTAKQLANDLQINMINNETQRTGQAVDLTKFREEANLKERLGEGI